MAKVFGVQLTKAELLARVGSIESLANVRRVTLEEGRGRGMQAYEVTCGRLRFTVYIDKCMDVGELYFDGMRSPAGQEPCGALAEALIRDFGSVRQWKEQMSQAAAGVFGSGWTWLVSDQDGTLMILTTANQDVPDLRLYTPILLIDMWEHAYYLQYRNRRPDYVQGWHKLIHWKKAEKRYEQVLCRLERGNENGEQTDHKKRTGRDRL